jgi:hypothetical protein
VPANVLILGRSQYGKSSVSEAIGRTYLEEGVECIVLEPFYTGRAWEGFTVVRTAKEFFDLVDAKTDCALFIEEYESALDSNYVTGDSDAVAARKIAQVRHKMKLLATGGRHQWSEPRRMGHVAHFSCHRLTQFGVTLRDQCPELYLFACNADDAVKLSKDYGKKDPILVEAPSLQKGDFMFCEPGEDVKLLHIDFATLEIWEFNAKRSWKPEAGA